MLDRQRLGTELRVGGEKIAQAGRIGVAQPRQRDMRREFAPLGFEPEPRETVLIGVAAQMAVDPVVPDGVTVVANGDKVGQTETGDGHTTWDYDEKAPMASYLTQLAIGGSVS